MLTRNLSSVLSIRTVSLAVHRLGLSMTLGAFIAGVLLSESSFRSKIMLDIEPFRGLLLGLFFITTGMSMDLSIFTRQPLEVREIRVQLPLQDENYEELVDNVFTPSSDSSSIFAFCRSQR